MDLQLKICLIVSLISVSSAHSYDDNDPDGPKNWAHASPYCGGKRQSPVNLNWFEAKQVYGAPKLRIQGVHKRPRSIRYANDGHGVAVSFNFSNGVQPTISGGPLKSDTYVFHSLHVHWKSEHTVNGRSFDAELHLVYYNSKYGSLKEAVSQTDGLAVLGFLYYVPTHSIFPSFNKIRPMINGTTSVREPDAVHILESNLFTLFEIIGTRSFTFWNYEGSLTTPKCDEVVTWMVNRVPIQITPAELQALKEIKDEKGNVTPRNNRPVQPLNGRTVFCY